jgi:flavin-dependent dehydrogenase
MRLRFTAWLAGAGMLVALALAAAAQEPRDDREEMKRNYEKKLEKEFLSKISWEHRLDRALARSKEKGLPVLVYFTRSYAP